MTRQQSEQIDWLDPKSLTGIFAGRHILVCVSGGIAAYKVCTIVSRLAQANAAVSVCMTPAATEFVRPLTFEALSGNPVHTDALAHLESASPEHISLADRCEIALVAPCTMNTLSDLVHGRADNIVTRTLAAINRKKTPVVIAPAMNDTMWHQPSNQRNITQAIDDGFVMVGPGDGWQACRHSGTGRMSEPGDVVHAMGEALGTSTKRA